MNRFLIGCILGFCLSLPVAFAGFWGGAYERHAVKTAQMSMGQAVINDPDITDEASIFISIPDGQGSIAITNLVPGVSAWVVSTNILDDREIKYILE